MNKTFHLEDILHPKTTLFLQGEQSRKQVLEHIAQLFHAFDAKLNLNDIFLQLLEREKLGTTAIGHGVAIPHARIEHLEKPIAAFVLLEQAIDFGQSDNELVDLFFALLVPEKQQDEHVQILSHIAEFFSNRSFRQFLRKSKSNKTLYDHAIS